MHKQLLSTYQLTHQLNCLPQQNQIFNSAPGQMNLRNLNLDCIQLKNKTVFIFP